MRSGWKSRACAWRGAVQQIPQISVHDLARERPQVQVVDVRRRAEWDEGHIEGAKLMPLGQLESMLGELRRDLPIAVHCKSGYRSAIGCSLIQRAWFEKVWNVIGGFDSWLACGLPEAIA